MATQTTTTTEETVAPSGPSMTLPEIPPWIRRKDPGWKDEEALKFSPRDLNTLIHFHQLRPFRFLAQQADSQNQNFASIEEIPVTPTPLAGRLGRQTRTPVHSAS